MLRALILSICGLLFFIPVNGQESREYIYNHLDKSDGLASNFVVCITQDHNGFIWIGTGRGLFRYDGTHIKDFTVLGDGNETFPNDIVLEIIEDKKLNLWLRFAGEQVGVLNPSTNKFRRVHVDREPIPNRGGIARLLQDDQGNIIFMNAADAIYTYNAEADQFSAKYNFIKLPEGWRPSGIDYDSAHSVYWIGCHQGLAKYNMKTKVLSYTGNNVENEWVIDGTPNQQNAAQIFVDQKNRTWVIGWAFSPVNKLKAVCHDPATKTRREYDLHLDTLVGGYYEVNGITMQTNGSIWMYGAPFIGHFNEKESRFDFLPRKLAYRYGIEFNHVSHVFNDREENLWVCTDKGVYVFNPDAQVFRRIKNRDHQTGKVMENSVNSILNTQNNEIWVGTWGEGIFIYDSTFKPLRKKLNGYMVWSICQRKNGEIWVGQQGGWIDVQDPVTGKSVNAVPKLSNDRTIRQILEDRNGRVWVGTQGGRILRWDPEAGKKNFDNGFTLIHDLTYVINSLSMDSKGFIWACTDVVGLYKFDPVSGQVVEHYKYTDGKERSLSNVGSSAVAEINDSLLIVLNRGMSILNRKTGKFRHIGKKEGLHSNNVHSIVRDKNGYFWLGTDEGVLRYNSENDIITAPSHEEGFVETRVILASATSLSDGRIAMGTEHDVVVFDPEEAFPDLKIPPVHITDFQVGDQFLPSDSVTGQRHITIQYGKTSIGIFYSSISQLQKSQLRYYYMLEGLDKDWIVGDAQQKAQYSFLPSGHYTFRVKAVNAYGNSSPESSIKIYVQPPFWRTPWFYAFLVLIAAILIYQYYKAEIQRRRKEEDMRTKIAANLHDNLSATLASVNVLGEMAKMKIDRDAEGAKDYISKITKSTSYSMEAMDEILWSINPDNDSMLKTAERMQKIAKDMLALKNIAYNFNVDETVLRMRMNMQHRHGLLRFYKSVIKDVAENSQCYQVNIDFQRNNGHFELRVEDDGKGYNLDDVDVQRSVEILSKKAEVIQGSLEIDSYPGKGTRVLLKFEA